MTLRNAIIIGLIFFAPGAVLWAQSEESGTQKAPQVETPQGGGSAEEGVSQPTEPTESDGQAPTQPLKKEQAGAEQVDTEPPAESGETQGQAGPAFEPGDLKDIPEREAIGEESAQPAGDAGTEPQMDPQMEARAEPSMEPQAGEAEAQPTGAEQAKAAAPMEATGAQAMEAETPPMKQPAEQSASEMSAKERWKREGVLPFLTEDDPPVTRIAILHRKGNAQRAAAITVLLNKFRKRELEKRLGGDVEVVNYAQAEIKRGRKGVIYYRPGHLVAALHLARIIPGSQAVFPMVGETAENASVDIEIHVNR